MAPAPVFFVSLRVFVPKSISNGWAWTAWTNTDPAGIERLRELEELPRLIRSYARATAEVLRFKDAERFNVTAFGGRSGAVLGQDVWTWNVELGAYRPHGEVWVPGLATSRLVVTQPLPVLRFPLAQAIVLRYVA